MEEQARLSNLVFDSDSKPPLWSTEGWPGLLDGWRTGHASIVIGEGNKESIIVLGGFKQNGIYTDSVLVMNTTEKKFREGPSMSEGRYFFAARKVNIGVYACGGINKSNKYSHTIERIDVNDLLETPASSTTGKWKTLPCRLTTPRWGCTACDVYNRYLVIVGGCNGSTYLSSVDILDTGGDGNHHTIIAGSDMNLARCHATSEVIGTRMFVASGQEKPFLWLSSVEYVEFGCHDNSANVSSAFQTNSCWTLDNDLALTQGISYPVMAKIGKCMIVADGSSSSAAVEVLDTDRHVVWSLPSMTVPRRCCSMVALSKCIAAIGGGCLDSVESLSICVSNREQSSFQKIMKEQARLSHLAFGSDSKPPQWSTDGWPRLLGGWRQGHVSIVIGEGNKESIVVLGGWTGKETTDSVLVINTTEKQFRQGPSMSERRIYFAVRKVNIGVYACGGSNMKRKKNSYYLDTFSSTIERIDVNDLLETPATSTPGKWKTLQCQLTTPRSGCTACDVMNRYLVIVGGHNGSTYLSSVDILDTGGDGNNHTIVVGIDMNCARYLAMSEVIGTRMYVAGGRERKNQWIRSVEYVEFGCLDNSGNACSVFQTNSSWTLDNDIALSHEIDRHAPAMAKIGKCLVVTGGHDLPYVEVLDTERHVVWSLPSMTRKRRGCSMVALSKSLVVVSGGGNESLESLSMRLSKREQLKVQSGKILAKDKKTTPHQCLRQWQILLHCFKQVLFYFKLVEASDDPMTGKVHELSALVFHAHHVKVFYTLLNHLFRSGLISLEYRRHYITKALKVISTTIRNAPEQEQEIFAAILRKVVKDGAISEINSAEIKQHHEKTGSTKQLPHETDVRQHLATMQFRVGKVHGQLIIDDTKSPPSSDVGDKNQQKNYILPEDHVLGWSLNQLQTAYYKRRHEEVAVAAICSILNACRFGANVQDRDQNKTGIPIAPRPLILPRIVDFGDIHHIGHVVEQSGVLSTQQAFAEGIALVDEAIAAAEQKEMMARAATNLAQHPRTGSLSSLDILVAVMDKFANALSQWNNKQDRNCGSNEEVTILALAVTAKLVQASEARDITTPTQTFFDSSNVECQKGNNRSSFHGSSHASAATQCDSTSNMRVAAPAVQNKQSTSIVARVERLESTMGNCFSLVQRISALEENCGLDGTTGMTLADRVSQLEDLALKDT